MKVAVSSYSFYQYVREGKMTILDTVTKAAELGFEAIEFIRVVPFDIDIDTVTQEEKIAYAKEIRAKAEECGIKIIAYTVGANLYWGNEVDDAKAVQRLCDEVDIAAALGAPMLRHDLFSTLQVKNKNTIPYESTIPFDKMMPTIVANARKVCDYAYVRGIKTCVENHGRIFEDIDRVERFYTAMDHENFGLLIDFGNFIFAEADPILAVSRLAPFAIHVHAKDFWIRKYGEEPASPKVSLSRACNQLSGCVIGEGDINVAQCVRILKNIEYDGYVSVEYEGYEDCIEGIKRGLVNLKNLIENA